MLIFVSLFSAPSAKQLRTKASTSSKTSKSDMDVADEDDVSGILFFSTFLPLLISVSLFQAFVSLFSAPSAKQLRPMVSTSSKTSTSVANTPPQNPQVPITPGSMSTDLSARSGRCFLCSLLVLI